MKLSFWILFVALVLSAIAAYYSILGLVTIFAAAAVPIIVMASAMEIAKVSVTVWLHRYWSQCRLPLKCYLVPAVLVLMLITSMGVFGLLSRAHSGQAAENADIAARVAVIDERIRTERENIEANRVALAQMNASVDQTLARSTTESGAGRAVQIRKSQSRERASLQAEIARAQERITRLSDERAPIAIQMRHAEAEVGPVRYVAALIYGDNPDVTMLERAVRWVIVLLVSVFDPLAIFMVLAAQESLRWEREKRPEPSSIAQDEPEVKPQDLLSDQQSISQDLTPHDWGTMDEVRLDSLEERINLANDRLTQAVAIVSQDLRTLSGTVTDPEPQPPEALAEENPQPEPQLVTEPEPEPFTEPEPEPEPDLVTELDPEPEPEPVEAAVTTGSNTHRKLVHVWKQLNPHSTLKEQRRRYEHGLIDTLPWAEPEFVARVMNGEFDHLED